MDEPNVELFHCENCGISKIACMAEVVRLGRAHERCQHLYKFKFGANINRDATNEDE